MVDIRRILLPTDFSQAASDAERRARALARLFEADLHVLHVTSGNELTDLPRQLLTNDKPAARRLIQHVSGWLGATDVFADASGAPGASGASNAVGASDAATAEKGGDALRVVRSVRQARMPHVGILHYAREKDVDLIVLGTRGRGGVRGPLLGSVADRVTRRADRPVVTVRPDLDTERPPTTFPTGSPSERLIVVPVDFSAPTETLVTHAKFWGDTFQSCVDFVHVVESGGPLRALDPFGGQTPQAAVDARERLQRVVDAAPGPSVDAETRVLFGTPADAIVQYARAQEARLLLMASHGVTGLKNYVLGGVTDRVVRSAPCPVCTLPPDGRSLVRPTPTAEWNPDAVPPLPAFGRPLGAPPPLALDRPDTLDRPDALSS